MISPQEIARAEHLMRCVAEDPGRFRSRRDVETTFDLDGPALDVLLRRHAHTECSAFLRSRRLDATLKALQRGDGDLRSLSDDLGWRSTAEAKASIVGATGMTAAGYGALGDGSPFQLRLPGHFRRPSVLAYLGRDPSSLYERVDGHLFRFAFRSRRGPVVVHAELGEEVVSCRLAGAGVDDPTAPFTAHRLLRRYLGWVIDPLPFEASAETRPLVRRLVAERHGLSIPQTPSVFDGLVWVIAGQQVSLAVAFALRRRLGRVCATAVDDDLWLPPRAEDVAALDEETLRSRSWSQRKTEYVQDISRAVVSGELDLQDLQRASAVRIESTLLARRGLGPWSVHYLMMRSFGLADCVPVGDAALRRNLRRFFELEKGPDAETTWSLMATFAPFRSLATFHFWASDPASQ